ncbi:unnamed protein product, partial [Ilex paraguariensis]
MGPISSTQAGIKSYKRVEEIAPNGGEQRKKNIDLHMEIIKAKNVTCERQVNKPTLRPHDEVIRAIEGHGLHFWYQAVE